MSSYQVSYQVNHPEDCKFKSSKFFKLGFLVVFRWVYPIQPTGFFGTCPGVPKPVIIISHQWLGGVTVRTLDLRSWRLEFESQSGRYAGFYQDGQVKHLCI